MIKLTKEEKELILQNRKKEEDAKPKMIGFLNRDLYSYGNGFDCCIQFEADKDEDDDTLFWLCDVNQIEIWKKKFSKHFEKVLPKGSLFVCYIEDGKESWYDDSNYGLEDMSDKWAKKYLIDIKPYAKTVKKYK